MAPASATAILAVSDRLVAERPEPKTPDASDGQFAGLMAQFVQPIPPAATPESAPAPTVSREASAERVVADQAHSASPSQGQAASEAPGTDPEPSSPSPKSRPADSKSESLSGTETAQAAAPSVEAGANPAPPAVSVISSAPGQVLIPLDPPANLRVAAVSPDPVAMQALAKAAEAAPAPLNPLMPATPGSPQVAPGTTPLSRSPRHRVETTEAGEPVLAATTPPGMPTAAPATASAMNPMAARRPEATATSQVQGGSIPAATGGTPLGEASAPIQITLPTPTGLDPVHPSVPAVIQAIFAEAKPNLKEPAKPEHLAAAPEATPSDPSLPAMKDPKMAETPAKVASLPPSPVPETPSEGPVKPPSALPVPEAQASKPALALPPPVAHASEGSSQAVLSAFPRAVDIAQAPVPVPTTPATPAAPPSAPVVQVQGGVHWMLKGGAQEAQLQLHPESLGQVTIHLKVEGGEVHARIWITEAASVQAVREGRPHLEMSLKEQGLQLGSFDLQQGHRPFQEAPSAPAFRDRAFSEAAPARQEAPAPAPVRILNAHRVELYA